MKSASFSGIVVSLATLIIAFVAHDACALDSASLLQAVQAEESALQARIGMAVIDTGSGTTWQYRGDERFPLNSTHKTFTCAALLAKVDQRSLSLNQSVSIQKDMLVPYSPITEKNLSPQTLTLGELCGAAVSYSDNTAANLVFEVIGGSAGFNAYLRSLGDSETRLDDGLSASSQAILKQWMLDDQVANALLRAALPPDWKTADKTGAGGHGSRSIIAVIWPPSGQALVVAIYLTQTTAPMKDSNQAIARIGRALKESIEQRCPSVTQNSEPPKR